MPKSKISLPLTTDHYTAIGRVTARAAALDVTIDAAIWMLLGVDELRGRIITARRDTSDKLKRLKALCEVLVTEEDDVRLPKILGDAKAANRDRNRVVHALWAAGETDQPVGHRYEIEKGLQHFKDDWPVEKLNRVADELENAAGNLLDFLRILVPNEPIPWPRTHAIHGLSPASSKEAGKE